MMPLVCVSFSKTNVRHTVNMLVHFNAHLRGLFSHRCFIRTRNRPLTAIVGSQFKGARPAGSKMGRCVHTTGPRMAASVLSAEELFAKESLQRYLRRALAEYSECARAEARAGGERRADHGDEELRRRRRARATQLRPLVEQVRILEIKRKELEDIEALAKDDDPDIRQLAAAEKTACEEATRDLRRNILCLLVPVEMGDDSDLVLEVTAGVGGQEAMLFTAEMFDMYQRFAAFKGWEFETLEYTPSDIGGLRHASATVSGPQSYKTMKFEGGVHRVQRVPRTEKQGRMHTSTMTVAVLPQPTEITLNISAKDLKIETKRASGAGGQHVNTTDSAVRIVHIPTGVVSECQQERSQLKNKEKAMKLLRAKLYSLKLEEESSKRNQARKIQIGTKGRSEKIRTYNFAQDRVTDHRIGKTVHDVKSFLLGEELLEEMSQFLLQFSEQEALLDILGEDAD
ncbi:peptide chain release factor 1-like, mitochondrial [Scleropages formosus]|uniref:Mitochondrial translation release factor 1 like n=1 Tax=Scleropages formosus TaxID=113540 RepID=A0A8C9QY20_SCLFO|nr:peptide chain release factor 1-like, mitochondrial [Scleropages formosus]